MSARSMSASLIRSALVTTVLAITASPALAQDIASKVPAEYRSGVNSALRGPNAGALKASYAELEGEERTGWAFLVANMPQHHVRKLTKDVLTENVRYAYKARDLPWNKGLSDELFLHYVLPALSGDEPAQQYRKQFFEEVVPFLKKKGAKSIIAGIGKLKTFPWKPDAFLDIEKKGSSTGLAPGWYVVQTGWRKGTSEVHFTLQVVEVQAGKAATLVLPGPKQTKPGKDGKSHVHTLKYPRK